MSKRRYGMTESRIAAWLAEGRGAGRGRAFKPWLTIHDVPSQGLAVRVKGATTGRIHHLLSGIERASFLECDWSTAITDIREQFPLSRAVTRRIASEMGVKHPSDRGVDVVMTTDLLLDVRGGDEHLSFSLPPGGGRRQLALSIKPDDAGLTARDLEKLEIERRYWRSLGVRWQLLFKHHLPEKQWIKLMWLHEWRSLGFMKPQDARLFATQAAIVLRAFGDATDHSMGGFTDRIDRAHGWARGTSLACIRHLAANRRLITPSQTLYDAWGPLDQFVVASEDAMSRRLVA